MPVMTGVTFVTVPVSPDIVIGIALLAAYGVYRQAAPWLVDGLPGMTLAHLAFQLAFATLVVRARLALIGRDQFEAARDLYASTWVLWRRVLLPQLLPGAAAAAGLAFALSVDDFLVSFLIAQQGSTTLPVLIHAQMRIGVSPALYALSTAVVLATVAAVLAIALVQGRTRRSPA